MPPASAELLATETLARLAGKPGVKATLVLDKNSGALLKTTGSVASILSQPVSARESTEEVDAGTKAMEEVAAMVWNFVTGAGDLVHTLDDEDEVKLLRLRTKKLEIVIVPDSKFLLVVVHDTPAA